MFGRLPDSIRPFVPGDVMARIVHLVALAIVVAAPAGAAPAQGRAQRDTQLVNQRWEKERALESIAVIDRKGMVPMRAGLRMATDIYRPKNAAGPVPIVFVRNPYNFNYWDVRNGAPRDMGAQIDAVKRGYAYIEMNERGHFFSEGNYDILGPPLTDGYDAIKWMSSQPWANGKVGLIGCSSTAEWQMAGAAPAPPGLGALLPTGVGGGG